MLQSLSFCLSFVTFLVQMLTQVQLMMFLKSCYHLIGCKAVCHEEASQQGAGGGGDFVLLRVCQPARRAQPCSSLLLRLRGPG